MRRLLCLAALCAATVALTATPALAHEHRGVGDHDFEVGWLIEPAYAGYVNAVQFDVSHDGGGPVTGAKVKVVVIFGGRNGTTKSPALDLVPSDEAPGEYAADIIPTRPGQYTFHVTGSLQGTEKVDQYFTSGEKTFDDVKEPRVAQFPAKDPSSGQLAQRLAGAEKDTESLGSRVTVALVVAVLALVVAAVGALARRR